MPTANPQRVVTINLNSIRDTNGVVTLKARYTYVSPVTGLSYQNAPLCDLSVVQATECLFVLDFQSTAAGWTFTGISAVDGYPLIPATLGAKNLSILTTDPYTLPNPCTPSPTAYKFYICYKNKITDEAYCEDPQESNGPPLPPLVTKEPV